MSGGANAADNLSNMDNFIVDGIYLFNLNCNMVPPVFELDKFFERVQGVDIWENLSNMDNFIVDGIYLFNLNFNMVPPVFELDKSFERVQGVAWVVLGSMGSSCLI